MMLKKSWKVKIVYLSMMINIGFIVILFTPVNRWVHQAMWVNVPLTEKKYDAIVICSSNFHFETDNGIPDESTLIRLEKGLRLYKEGYAHKIIALGGIAMEKSHKTTAVAIKERLMLYGVPEKDIIVQDDVIGKLYYYENILSMIDKYKGSIDFNKVIFVTSIDQSLRLFKALKGLIANPKVVTGEPYELVADWGQRFHVFRRIANEIIFAHPYFYFTGRFSVPSTFKWVIGNPHLKKDA